MISRSGIIAYANRYAEAILTCDLLRGGGVSQPGESDSVSEHEEA